MLNHSSDLLPCYFASKDEAVWASNRDATGKVPCGDVQGTSNWEETPGKMKNTMSGTGLRTPLPPHTHNHTPGTDMSGLTKSSSGGKLMCGNSIFWLCCNVSSWEWVRSLLGSVRTRVLHPPLFPLYSRKGFKCYKSPEIRFKST